jgi:membrane protease YdiL (CAAX protease family)
MTALLAVVLASGVAVGGALLGQIVIAPAAIKPITRWLDGIGGYPLLNTIYLIIGFTPVYVGVILLSLLVRSGGRRDLLNAGRRPVAWILIGCVVGVALICGTAFIAAALGSARIEFVSSAALRAGIWATVLGLLAWCFQSLAEELVFRGWLQPKITRTFGPLVAVIVSSLAFAAAHSINAAFSASVFVGLLFMGGVFSMLRQQSGAVWAPAAAHAMMNWCGYVVCAWTQAQPGALLVVMPPEGKPLFGDGPVISIWPFFALCAAILIALCWHADRAKTALPAVQQA